MKIRDRQLLINYMEDRDISGARLGRHAEVSREFIRALRIGRKTTCTPKVADRIEEALGLLKGTLFEDSKSPEKRPAVKKQAAA
jgi:plasmid maintenance system antidote protein VapI